MKAVTRPILHFLAALLLSLPLRLPAQNVGIGTASPMEKLHVAGGLRVDVLSGVGSRLVGADANGTLEIVAAGTTGQVLTQGATGPIWQDGSGWGLLGNAGTTPTTNFVGTTDLQGLAFRTNNVERMRITDAGLVCVNGTGPYAADQFSVYATGGQWAVNGYATGSGDAGYFYNAGTGAGVVGLAVGASGSAAEFMTLSGTPNGSSTVYVYNGAAVAPGFLLRSDVADPASHGIFLDINGASNNKGLIIDMDAATTGDGTSILHYGLGRALTLQNFNTGSVSPSLIADHAGNGRPVAARSYLTTGTTQTAYFVQSSSGLLPPTYANAAAVWGQSDGIRGGAFLSAGPTSSTTALQALYNGPAGNYDGVAIYGLFQPNPNYGYGVVGQGNWYGVYANGNLGASGVKSFMIDHPLDPGSKYLRHFAIESPEVLNLYRGTAVLDANGVAEVQLPSYFHAINIDFSYQLTPVGSAAALFVAQEIDGRGRFQIAGGSPGQKVCWSVYADRNDAFVQQNPESIQVEPMKRAADVGLYLQPELHGQPQAKGLFERNKAQPGQVKAETVPKTPVAEVPVPQVKGQD
jgi:hypothetical protein